MKQTLEPYLPEIAASPMFRGIRREDLVRMLHCLGAFLREFEKEAYICMSDEDLLYVGVVLTGGVQMIREDVWGNRALLVYMGPGELFGETFVCAGIHNRLVSYAAAEKTVVLFTPFKRVICSCEQSCGFHRQLIENVVVALAEKNVALIEKVDLVSKRSLREKISEYLALQAEYYGSMEFDIPLGRVQLAQYLHADRSALTRELGQMAGEGLIEFNRRHFRILRRLL